MPKIGRWIHRLERLGIPVAGRERKKKREKQRENIRRNENPIADTFVHGMPWYAYAIEVKANGKGHKLLS